MKKVNIVIPVHNRPEHTRQTIESLYANTDPELFSLYVVNDASDTETLQVIDECQQKYAFHLHHTQDYQNIGPGAARNEVCNYITKNNERGEYLYHSDNDVYFIQGWLDKIIYVFRDCGIGEDVKVLGASCHPFLQNKEILWADSINRVGIKDAVSGYSQLMTWDTWDTFGPFDETMRGAEKKIMGSEDWAFCQKIVKAGFKVGSIEPEVVVPCGKTNTYGEPATGSETFKNTEGVMVK